MTNLEMPKQNKILLISLLRLGDVFSALPIFRGLRRKYPHAEIHILVNRQCLKAAHMLVDVDRVYAYDMDKPLSEQIDVAEIKMQHYNLAVNLTHTKLSGLLMDQIYAEARKGLTIKKDGSVEFYSPWIRYLNNQIVDASLPVFHHMDLFGWALDIKPAHLENLRHGLRVTTDLEQSAEHILSPVLQQQSPKKVIGLQVLTSDSKKNWEINRFADLMCALASARDDLHFVILGAPQEKEALSPLLETLEQRRCQFPLLSWQVELRSLDLTYALLKKFSLLITLDTSIKHLAAHTDCAILELSIGSSDPRILGAYSDRAMVIQAQEPCAPCSHSRPCHRGTHYCSQQLSVARVQDASLQMLDMNINNKYNNIDNKTNVQSHEAILPVELKDRFVLSGSIKGESIKRSQQADADDQVESLRSYLLPALKYLEREIADNGIDLKKKIIVECIKEQFPYENFNHSTGPTR